MALELRGALGGERDLELRGSTVFWNIVDLESTLFQHILQLLYYADFKGVVWSFCTTVMQKSNISNALSFSRELFVLLHIWTCDF